MKLSKEHLPTGLRLMRKLIEIENPDCMNPSAEWKAEDWDLYTEAVKEQQDELVK
jgi:hypothetical protein